MLDIKIILNIFYKPSQFIDDICRNDMAQLYFPINGGSSLKKYKNVYPWLNFDNEGDNISCYNDKINEFSSIYWFWKNFDLSNLNYIGFSHYRRLFIPSEYIYDYHDYDIIVRDTLVFKSKLSLLEQYQQCHYSEDMKTLIDLLNSEFSDDNIFFKYLTSNINFKASCNMFIMKKQLFLDYCNYVFPIIRRLLQIIDFKIPRSSYQNRTIAFLLERLTSYWILQAKQKNNLKVKEVPILFVKE